MSSSTQGQNYGSGTATTSRRRPQNAGGRRDTAQREGGGARERKERQKMIKKNLFTKDREYTNCGDTVGSNNCILC